MSESDWERVETLGSETEAALVVGFLETNGIAARVDSRFFHQEPVTFGALAEVRICVAPEDVPEARRLLAERRARFDVIDGEDLSLADAEGEGPDTPDDEGLREGHS